MQRAEQKGTKDLENELRQLKLQDEVNLDKLGKNLGIDLKGKSVGEIISEIYSSVLVFDKAAKSYVKGKYVNFSAKVENPESTESEIYIAIRNMREGEFGLRDEDDCLFEVTDIGNSTLIIIGGPETYSPFHNDRIAAQNGLVAVVNVSFFRPPYFS